MKNKLEFKFKPKKNPKQKLIVMIASIVVILFLFVVFHENERLMRISPIVYNLLIIWVIQGGKYYRSYKNKNKIALFLTPDRIEGMIVIGQLVWRDVKNITYKIKHVTSYLIVEMERPNNFIQDQKWYKRPVLKYVQWRFGTPFVLSLDVLDGDTSENFKKIEKFVKENNLLQTA